MCRNLMCDNYIFRLLANLLQSTTLSSGYLLFNEGNLYGIRNDYKKDEY